MSIEDAIKQTTPFKNPYHRVMVNLIYTSNWVSDNQAKLLKPFGLTIQQYNVLRILRGNFPDPVKVADITERMLDKMSNASRLVDKLLLKKLVLRTECPADRRAVDIVVTDAGMALLTKIDLARSESDWHRSLTESEAVQLSSLLDKMRNQEE